MTLNGSSSGILFCLLGVVGCLIYATTANNNNQKCEAQPDGATCNEEDDSVMYSSVKNQLSSSSTTANEASVPKLVLSVVACGDRLEETLVMIKSAAMFSKLPIHVHIFADDSLMNEFIKKFEAWPADVWHKLTFKMHPIQFPADQNAAEWRKLFKPCASQRLFIPDLLTDVDALIYVDTDILFLRPLEDVWRFFKEFNDKQIAGLVPEHEEPAASWYPRFARHPYVPPYGVNSGVMLMNLTRMRELKWLNDIIPYYAKYRYDITWGDQDLINIYFHFYSERLYQFSCDWNYRPDHCMYMSVCKHAEQKGVSVVHGCRSVYHNDKQPVFKAIYQTLRDYQFGDDLKLNIVDKMKKNIRSAEPSTCAQVSHIFTKQLEEQIRW